MLIWLIATLGVLGVLILVVGLRGRRTDNHPVCRRCRFDLDGLYPGCATCPECGEGLDSRNIRSGNRQRRRGLILVGAGAAAAAIGAGVVLGWGSATKFNWNTVKPVFLLAMEADGADALRAEAALKELLARLGNDKLSPNQVDGLLERGLTAQADEGRTWRVGWGELIESTLAAGRLGEARLARYARHAFIPRLEARARVRRGDIVPVAIVFDIRAGTGGMLEMAGRHVAMRMESEPMERSVSMVACRLAWQPGGPSTMREFYVPIAPADQHWPSPSATPTALPPGHHKVVSRWVFTVREGKAGSTTSSYTGTGLGREEEWDESASWDQSPEIEEVDYDLDGMTRNWRMTSSTEKRKSIGTWRSEVSAIVEVLPDDTDSIEIVTDSALRDRVEAAVTSNFAMVSPEGALLVASGGVRLSDSCPVAIACDAFLRCNGREQPVGGFVCSPSGTDRQRTGGYFGKIDPIDLSDVTLVLKPNPDLARRSVFATRVWGEPIVLSKIKVYDGRSQTMGAAVRLSEATRPANGGASKTSFEIVAEFVMPEETRYGIGSSAFRSCALKLPYVYVLDRTGALFIFKTPGEGQTPRVADSVMLPNIGDGGSLAIVDQVLLCSRFGAIDVYTLEDPLAPRRVGTFGEAKGSSSQLVVHGTTGYSIQRGKIGVFDLTDLRALRHVGSEQIEMNAWSACISGNTLCVCGYFANEDRPSGVTIFDISEPHTPKQMAFIPTQTTPYHAFACGPSRIALALDPESLTSSGSGVHGYAAIIDLSDPVKPRLESQTSGAGGRAATMLINCGKSYMICNGAVFAVEQGGVTPVYTFASGDSTLDGAPYRGDSDATHAALVLDGKVLLLGLRGE